MADSHQPGMLLTTVATLIIAFCLFFVSLCLGMFSRTWDVCGVLGGICLLPFPTSLGMMQFIAVFRRSARLAKGTAIYLFVLAGFAAFAVISSIAEAIYYGDTGMLRFMIGFIMSGLGVSAAFLGSGYSNLYYARKLHSDPAYNEGQRLSIFRFSTRELLVGLTALTIMTAFVTYFFRNPTLQWAEHVSRDKVGFGLPANATDICYYRGPRETITFEFSSDEAGFRQFVAKRNNYEQALINPITSPTLVHRYCESIPGHPGPSPIEVVDGLEWGWHEKDIGSGAVFDRKTGRIYYNFHSY